MRTEKLDSPWQREVFRRRPIYMVVDDHEFRNDYCDIVACSRPQEFGVARQAARYYQIDAGPRRMHSGDPRNEWRSFAVRGFKVFLTDTRTDRADKDRITCADAKIMKPRQMKGNSPPSTVLDDGDERQAETSTTCWSSAKEMRHARPSQ